MRKIHSHNLSNPVLMLLTILLVVIASFPVIVMLMTSIKPLTELLSSDSGLWPKQATFKNYRFLFNIPSSSPLAADGGQLAFLRMIFNTLIYAFVTSAIAVPMAIFAGYALAKERFRFKPLLISFLLFSYLLPTTAMIVPMFQLISMLGLYNSAPGIILTYQILILPLNVWMLASFFKTVPDALVEAALIDGSSHTRAILRVIVPVSAPCIAAVTTFSIIVIWQEFMYNLILIKKSALHNVQVGMQSFFQFGLAIDWGVVMAASVLVALPMALLFTFMHQYIVGGLTVGAVKG